MLSKISLRLRLTIVTCTILIVACACLTILSIFNAGNLFSKPVEAIRAVPSGSVPSINYESTAETLSTAEAAFAASKKGFTKLSVLLMFAIIGSGTLLTWFLSGKALKPVISFSKSVEEIDENNLSMQLPVPKSRDEVARLTHSFNHMLAKISMTFESQKQFSQNAAHELKTPLSTIMANIEVMEMDEDSASVEEYKEVLLDIKQSAERMTILVQDMLALHAAEKKGETERFSIRDLFLFILKEKESELQKKNVSVQLEGDRTIYGNRFMLERAFSNLIQNAIRYNRDNGSITIQCTESTVVISDSGIGIPSDKLPHIFEPFFCADASRSKALGGSGLGLAITKEIFDQHHFSIEVTSDGKTGTTCTIKNF